MREALRSAPLARLGIVAILILVWEIVARVFASPDFLVPPGAVITGLPSLVAMPGMAAALGTTLYEVATAFVLSVAIGAAIGVTLGLSRFARRTFMPIVLLLYATPKVTIMPLFILYFGIGPGGKIAFGVAHGAFPVLVAAVAGLEDVEPILRCAATAMGATRWQMFRHVLFPHMVPGLFTGMRLAMTAVLLGVVLAELYVSQGGIGFFAQQFTVGFDPTNLFGLVAIVAAIAIVLNEVVRRAEIRFSRWRTT